MDQPGLCAVRRFVVEALAPESGQVRLDPATSHHLLVVCRHPRGAQLIVFDRGGLEADAELIDVEEGCAVLRLCSAPRSAAVRTPRHLVLGLPRGPALDHALRMAVELGITHLHPVLAARSVRRSDRADRWQRILEGAARQCGRADVPELRPLSPLDQVLPLLPDALACFVGVPGGPRLRPGPGPAALAIGPEGGFTPAEIQRALAVGWQPAGLGAWVLRTDTAVAAGLALLAPDPGPGAPGPS
ncbi:MAG TPA: 16S rRNA (uracil(1498)-N(3))-methyltransferase [Deltaproteobacteria bacterium]|nr:16S rRNA (uracil(1498)-N(3))-methyltransferase [Deltaproteobacteria bacterium]